MPGQPSTVISRAAGRKNGMPVMDMPLLAEGLDAGAFFSCLGADVVGPISYVLAPWPQSAQGPIRRRRTGHDGAVRGP